MARINKLVVAVSPAALADAFEQFDQPSAFVKGIADAAADFEAKQKAKEKAPPTFKPRVHPYQTMSPAQFIAMFRIKAGAAESQPDPAEEIFGPPTIRPRALSIIERPMSDRPELKTRAESVSQDFKPAPFPLNPSFDSDMAHQLFGPPAKISRALSVSEDEAPFPNRRRRGSASASTAPFLFDCDPETEAPKVAFPPDFLKNARDQEMAQFLYGMFRISPDVVDLNEDRNAFTFPTDLTPSVPAQAAMKADKFVFSSTSNNLDALVRDDRQGVDDEMEAWFASFPTARRQPLDPLGPVYAHHERLGLPKEEEDDEETKKKKKERPLDISPTFACILLANGYPVVPYPKDTIQAVGNIAGSRFATTVRIDDRLFTRAHLEIALSICYGVYNVQLASVTLAMDDLLKPPSLAFLNANTLKTCFENANIQVKPPNGAYLTNFSTTNDNSSVIFKDRAIRELKALQMPGLIALQNRLDDLFLSDNLNLSILVTDQWKDFEDWTHKFGQVYADSQNDPTMALKADSKGQPITIRNYVPRLPPGARVLPAETRFRSVDELLTRLGDASAREHAYEKWSSEELGKIECKALMMPIGSQTCILKRDGQDVEVPYLYSFSVLQASNLPLFNQLAPPLNAAVKIQVEIPYTKVATPIQNKTPQEIVEMIAGAMHNELWKHRPKNKVAKAELEQKWADDYAEIIKPYVKAEKFDNQQEVIQGFSYMISLKLQKIRADKDDEIKAETPKEHRARTTELVNKYRNHLKVPVDTTADVPQFKAVRMAHDEPLSNLSDFQFVAYRPKQMGWPKAAAGTAPAPFLDFREPRAPAHKTYEELVKRFAFHDKKREDKYLVPIRFVAVDDDVSAKSKVQGLLRMKQFQSTPVVNWFTTFKGNPITADITDVFSVLRRAMHHYYYDAALPFHEDEISTAPLYPLPREDADGETYEITTTEFQHRETIMTQRLFREMAVFSDDQISALRMLTKAPFGLLVIEGVPGSGKTRLAHAIVLSCIYSSVSKDMRTVQQPSAPKIQDFGDNEVESDSESEPEDSRYKIKPTISKPTISKTATTKTAETKVEEKPAPPPTHVEAYDFPRLACGPAVYQLSRLMEEATASAKSRTQFLITVFNGIRDVYYHNFESIRPINLPKSVTDRVRDKHWNAWASEVMTMLVKGPDTEIELNPPVEEPESDNPAETTEDIMMALGFQADDHLEHLNCSPQVLIIANQNVNGDDAAALMEATLNEELKFNELIIRVTNLDLERKALKTGFRPEYDDGVRHTPGFADLIHMGIDSAKLNAFATRTGDFKPRKHGGVWKLETIMRKRLEDGEKPGLMRQLRRLSNPQDVLTREEMQALDKSIEEFMRQILDEAKVVICTFVIAQSLAHKKLFSPAIVLIDEASREPELLVRWAQTALGARLLIFVGDWRQDEPFVAGRYTKEETQLSIFLPQLLTPLSKRIMKERPDCVVFLSENRRQQAGLQEIASDVFYDGNMRTVYDPLRPSQVAKAWYGFAQELIREMRALKKDKDVDKGRLAELLTGNRVTVVCNSSMTKRGLSSVSAIQAQLAVNYAAQVHQSQIPGSDGLSRPRICIITPYSAQVDEIKSRLRQASDKELCRDLIEVRTQTASTGGEWDVVILCLVRNGTMGFLSETNRLNVMWTRPKLLSIDIFDTEFFDKPKGHRSIVIRRYKDYQVRNGAVCRDHRNWGAVCTRCCKPHDKECREVLRCFFCYENHHARNCRGKGTLQPIINPDLMNLPPPEKDEDDTQAETEQSDNAGEQVDEEQPPVEAEQKPAEQEQENCDAARVKKPAKALAVDLEMVLEKYLNDKTEPLVMNERWEPPPGYELDDVEDEEEDQEDEQDDGKDYDLGKIPLRKKKNRRGIKKPTDGIWTNIFTATNNKTKDEWSAAAADTNQAWDNADANQGWDNADASGENNTWSEPQTTTNDADEANNNQPENTTDTDNTADGDNKPIDPNTAWGSAVATPDNNSSNHWGTGNTNNGQGW